MTCLDQSEAGITCSSSRLSRLGTALTAAAPVVKGSSGVKFPRTDSITVLVSRLVPVKEASAPLTGLPLKAASEAVSAAPRKASENGPIRG